MKMSSVKKVKKAKQSRVYMDHAAATPMDESVKRAMEPYWGKDFGNPNALYKEGLIARNAVEKARAEVARVFGARTKEIIFTNGGTESDNLAILGVAGAFGSGGKLTSLGTDKEGKPTEVKLSSTSSASSDATQNFALPTLRRDAKSSSFGHIITTKFEHHAVLEACRHLEKNGFEVTYLDVGKDGIVDPGDVKKALRPETILVSIMYANNEIGTIQPIKEIAKVIRNFKKENQLRRKAGAPIEASGGSRTNLAEENYLPLSTLYPLFHTDACQAPGYLDLSVQRLGVDLMTINGSKIYGPKGTGILFVKDGIKLQPILYGGEQEKKLRPGTENVAGIVGIAEALRLADADREEESARLSELRDYFIKRVTTEIPKVILNGHPEERLPNNVNVSILDAEGESIVLYLDEAGVACSTGSACTSESLEPSHVLMAIGRSHAYAHGAMRFSFGKSTTKKDIDYVMKVLPGIIEKLRAFSPVKIK